MFHDDPTARRLEGKPTVEIAVRPCRDCRFSVSGANAEGSEADDLAVRTAPAAALLGEPFYHLALAKAPLYSTVRADPMCGPDAGLIRGCSS